MGTMDLYPMQNNLFNTVYTSEDGYPAYHVTTTSILSPPSSAHSSSCFTFKNTVKSTPMFRLTRHTTTITRVDRLNEKKAMCGEVVATIRWNSMSFKPATIKVRDGEEMNVRDYIPFAKARFSLDSDRNITTSSGERFRWKYAKPQPELFDSQNNRIAKFYRPFLHMRHSQGLPTTSRGAVPVLVISKQMERETVDEILTSLLLLL